MSKPESYSIWSVQNAVSEMRLKQRRGIVVLTFSTLVPATEKTYVNIGGTIYERRA